MRVSFGYVEGFEQLLQRAQHVFFIGQVAEPASKRASIDRGEAHAVRVRHRRLANGSPLTVDRLEITRERHRPCVYLSARESNEIRVTRFVEVKARARAVAIPVIERSIDIELLIDDECDAARSRVLVDRQRDETTLRQLPL